MAHSLITFVPYFTLLVTALHPGLCRDERAEMCDRMNRTLMSDNQRLFCDILVDYDMTLRPVKDWRTTVNCTVKFNIMQLYSVIAPRKEYEVIASVTIKWFDEYLTWNPDDYNGLRRFFYPHNQVWKPEFLLLNAADEDFDLMNKASTNVEVRRNGHMVNSFISRYKPTCSSMDVTYFPFDRHRCDIKLGSWTYAVDELDFDIHTDKYLLESEQWTPNAEWDLTTISRDKVTEKNTDNNKSYPYVKIVVELRRKPLFYVFNIIAPTLFMCLVAFVGMFTPTDSSGQRAEKVNLGVAALLAISVLMLMVSEFVPVSGDRVMIISWVMQFFFVLVATATLFTSIVLIIDCQGNYERPVPQWARRYFLHSLAGVLCVHFPPAAKETSPSPSNSNPIPRSTSTHTRSASDSKTLHQSLNMHQEQIDSSNLDKMGKGQWEQLFAKLSSLDHSLQRLLTRKEQRDEADERRREWTALATVIERLFLVLCLAAGVITAITLHARLEAISFN